VRINQLTGWPPRTFQAAEARGAYVPRHASRLRLQAASLLPRIGPKDLVEVFLLLRDPDREQACSLRFRVSDPATAIRMAQVLTQSRGKSLSEIGELEIAEKPVRMLT
jgi:hypothetical protein